MMDAKEMLRRAALELTELRRQNEVLAARSHVIDVFSAALLGATRGGAMHPDIVWEINNFLSKEGAE